MKFCLKYGCVEVDKKKTQKKNRCLIYDYNTF